MERLKSLDGKDAPAHEKVEKIEHFAASENTDGARVSYIRNIKLADNDEIKRLAGSAGAAQDAVLQGIVSSVFNRTSDLRDRELDWKAYLLDDRKSVFASVRIDVSAGYAKENEAQAVAQLCEYCEAFEKRLSEVVGKALLRSFRR